MCCQRFVVDNSYTTRSHSPWLTEPERVGCIRGGPPRLSNVNRRQTIGRNNRNAKSNEFLTRPRCVCNCWHVVHVCKRRGLLLGVTAHYRRTFKTFNKYDL